MYDAGRDLSYTADAETVGIITQMFTIPEFGANFFSWSSKLICPQNFDRASDSLRLDALLSISIIYT